MRYALTVTLVILAVGIIGGVLNALYPDPFGLTKKPIRMWPGTEGYGVLSEFIDEKTGCEYIGRADGALLPRVNRNKVHICRDIPGV